LTVKISKIAYENFHEVIDLEVEKYQEENLPSNMYSLAESSFSSTCHPRAIWSDEKIVGFLMYRFGEYEDDKHECVIWRFMVDRRHQNTGVGTAAMALLMDEIKAHKPCKVVEIHYDPKNIAAKKIYTSFGFEVVGKRDDGDVIAELSL